MTLGDRQCAQCLGIMKKGKTQFLPLLGTAGAPVLKYNTFPYLVFGHHSPFSMLSHSENDFTITYTSFAHT